MKKLMILGMFVAVLAGASHAQSTGNTNTNSTDNSTMNSTRSGGGY